MEADKVRAALADVAALHNYVHRYNGPAGALAALDEVARNLGAELPPARGTFAGSLNGATLKTR